MEWPDYPWLYRASDIASLNAQRCHFRALGIQLGIFLGVAVLAAFPTWVHLCDNTVRKLAVVAAVALAAGLLLGAISREKKYEKAWFDFRAIAESAKTLTWRYMMLVHPFEREKTVPEQLFVLELQAISNSRPACAAGLGGIETDRMQISDTMRRVRNSSFEERKAYFLGFRVSEQRDWYHRKAGWNRRRGQIWYWVVIGIQFVALIGAVLRAASFVQITVAGLLMTLAASLSAWTQAKRHDELGTSYSVAADELTNLEQLVELCSSETQLLAHIEDVEEAISREHTMWRARRNVAP